MWEDDSGNFHEDKPELTTGTESTVKCTLVGRGGPAADQLWRRAEVHSCAGTAVYSNNRYLSKYWEWKVADPETGLVKDRLCT